MVGAGVVTLLKVMVPPLMADRDASQEAPTENEETVTPRAVMEPPTNAYMP